MILKVIGAILVICGCGSVGFLIAANHRREEKMLRQLEGILNFMECQLQYRLTPLPLLCRQVAAEFPGAVGNIFWELALEMESHISPDIAQCTAKVLNNITKIPPLTAACLLLLGQSIGRFDIEGQLRGIESVRQECRRKLEGLSVDRDVRLRSYQTLGLCAGAALAILFI